MNTLQAVVGVELFAMVTLNVSIDAISSSVRQSFTDVLEMAFESIVEGPSNATIRFPLEATRSRRLLGGDSVDLEVKITATRDCHHTNCQAYGARVVDGIEENIRTEIAGGGLTESVRALAKTNNVPILETADVYAFTFLNETITADSVVVSETDDETSSAYARIGQLSGFLAIVSFSLLL